jgi:hypothetical protein
MKLVRLRKYNSMSNEVLYNTLIDFRVPMKLVRLRKYNSVIKEVLYNILIDFRVPMKLVRLIKICLNETNSKVCVINHLFDSFPIENNLIQRDDLSSLLSTLL